jgi:hypothetical protein
MLPKCRSFPAESANRVARWYNAPSRELRFDLRDNSRATHETRAQRPRVELTGVNSRAAVMPAMTRADRQNTASWSSILTFFMEGFALYGASYGTLLQAAATSPVQQRAGFLTWVLHSLLPCESD